MIFKDIAEYEETDSQLSKDTMLRLHKEIQWYEKENKHNQEIIIKQEQELQQKENIIKEVRELCDYESTNVESLISDILEILDKTN